MRSTYLILVFLTQMIFIAIIILSPIYITPGFYWWSILFFILLLASGSKASDRINEWNHMDRFDINK